MKYTDFAFLRILAALILSLSLAGLHAADGRSDSAVATTAKPRLIVLTDIGTEPDDAQSMVRLLLYSNEIDIEGLVATTSVHMRNETHPELIEQRVRAYGEVLPNLRVHAAGYPEAAQLLSRIRSGSAVYGMSGVGDGKDTEASRLIIEVVDRPDPRPVWITMWGGASNLAQALWTVRATRSPAEVNKFVAKLRVYSISDQDDGGPWARMIFPQLFWVSSIHGFTQYQLATWVGLSNAVPGSDPTLISRSWLNQNIRRKGPLGAVYPQIMFGMEGDTPSFLYLVPTGLGSPEHPDWGSWGGRYGQIADFLGLWTSVVDTVRGVNGQDVTSNQATVWRWRSAFQNDFAARMDWSVHAKFADANHSPQVLLNRSAGQAPVEITARAGEPIMLSASGSTDPDKQNLTYRWWWYREVNGAYSPTLRLDKQEGPETTAVVSPWTQPSKIPLPPVYRMHVILEVTDNGTPALTRYRRAVIIVPTSGIPIAPAGTPWWEEKEPVVRSSPAAAGVYTTAETEIGALLDDPAARAVLDKRMPGFSSRDQISMARGMTLKSIQHFDRSITDQMLVDIDADLAKLPAK